MMNKILFTLFVLSSVSALAQVKKTSVRDLEKAVDHLLERNNASMAQSLKRCEKEFTTACKKSGRVDEDFGCFVTKVKIEEVSPGCKQQLVATSKILSSAPVPSATGN